mmetsp:Transcript_14407/g.41055  ORF Transcript_14407/g.41055 Transcript_14407/m.41055 type:complete len:374 (-) Transcript_14407:77-1198(-)
MEYDGGIQMSDGASRDYSKTLSCSSERSFALASPVRVTFVMEDAMFEYTFECVPHYGDLWKAVCHHLHVDNSASLSFKFYMDDVLLTHGNIVDMFADCLQSATMTASVVLMVAKHACHGGFAGPADDPSKPAAPPRGRPCRTACFYAAYAACLLALLLPPITLTAEITRQEEQNRLDKARIGSLTSFWVETQEHQASQMYECITKKNLTEAMLADGGHQMHAMHDEKIRHMTTINNLTSALTMNEEEYAAQLEECNTKIHNLTDMLVVNNNDIRKNDERILGELAKVDELTSTLATTHRQQVREIRGCNATIDGLSGQLGENQHRIDFLSNLTQRKQEKLSDEAARIDDLTVTMKRLQQERKKIWECWQWLCT